MLPLNEFAVTAFVLYLNSREVSYLSENKNGLAWMLWTTVRIFWKKEECLKNLSASAVCDLLDIDRSSCLVSGKLFQRLQCKQRKQFRRHVASLGGIWTFVNSTYQSVLRPPSLWRNDKFGESQTRTAIESYQDLSNRLPTWALHKACTACFLWTDKPVDNGIPHFSRFMNAMLLHCGLQGPKCGSNENEIESRYVG